MLICQSFYLIALNRGQNKSYKKASKCIFLWETQKYIQILNTIWIIAFYIGILAIFRQFFFLSNDLHILQIIYIMNKNITKITIWKTTEQKHWTLSAIIKSKKVIKIKGI